MVDTSTEQEGVWLRMGSSNKLIGSQAPSCGFAPAQAVRQLQEISDSLRPRNIHVPSCRPSQNLHGHLNEHTAVSFGFGGGAEPHQSTVMG